MNKSLEMEGFGPATRMLALHPFILRGVIFLDLSVVGISNSFFVVFGPLLTPIPNFIQIGQKTQVENVHYWSVLVGWAGRSINGRSRFKHSECVQRLTNDLCTKFKPNRMKIDQVSPS